MEVMIAMFLLAMIVGVIIHVVTFLVEQLRKLRDRAGTLEDVIGYFIEAPHQLLAGTSLFWILVVVFLHNSSGLSFYISLGLIIANLVVSLYVLFRQGTLLVGLNTVQVILFGVLHYQLWCAFGQAHFSFDTTPTGYDWLLFSGAHILRAVDVLDGIEAYGLDLQNIEHTSVVAGMLLVFMHCVTDVFLLSLLARRIRRLLRERWVQSWSSPQIQLRTVKCCCLFSCVGLVVASGIAGQWSVYNWLVWPLDNVLRTVDVADMFQIFHWRLHSVPTDIWNGSASILFRFLSGILIVEWIGCHWFRVTRGRGSALDELVDRLGSQQQAAIARTSLIRVGSPAVPVLVQALGNEAQRDEAAQALAAIGVPTIPHVIPLLAEDNSTAMAALFVIEQIGPAAHRQLDAALRNPTPVIGDGADLPFYGASSRKRRFQLNLFRCLVRSGIKPEKLARYIEETNVSKGGCLQICAEHDLFVEVLQYLLPAEKTAMRKAIDRFNPAAVPGAAAALERALRSENADTRHTAIRFLPLILSYQQLLLTLRDKDEVVRGVAAAAICTLNYSESRLHVRDQFRKLDVDPVTRLVLDCLWHMANDRMYEAKGAEVLKATGVHALPALTAALNGATIGDAASRRRAQLAALALVQLGVASVETLSHSLRKESLHIRSLAIQALERIGPPAIGAVGDLRLRRQTASPEESKLIDQALLKIEPRREE